VLVRFADDAFEGREEEVPPARLKERWADAAPFRERQQPWDRVREAGIPDDNPRVQADVGPPSRLALRMAIPFRRRLTPTDGMSPRSILVVTSSAPLAAARSPGRVWAELKLNNSLLYSNANLYREDIGVQPATASRPRCDRRPFKS
jgi:hypothetical protein